MFKRRQKATFLLRIRELLWPRMGLKRAQRYLTLRLARLSAAPEPVARGIACGITVSFIPVFGIHAVAGMAFAYVINANMMVAALATLVLPPVILPLIFSLDFLIGKKIMLYFGYYAKGNESDFVSHTNQGASYILEHFADFFVPAFLGASIFMLMIWPASYMAAHKLLGALAHHRKRKKKETDTTS